MIEDGLPAALALTAEQRRAARNMNDAISTMETETAPRLAKQETDEMKKITATAKKAASNAKKSIHVPRKPKMNPKLPATHPANRGAKKTAVQARRSVGKPAAPKKERAKRGTGKPTGRQANPQTRVTNAAIADATCRAGGVSMADLVKEFGIDAHPMRAKIHYAKHKLGYVIKNREGRYYGTAPSVSA